jgi:hypothetical protein
MFKPKAPIAGRLENSSGERIRTTDLRVMSCNCKNVTLDQQYSKISQPNERWFLFARYASFPQLDDLDNRCSYCNLLRGFVKLFSGSC